MLQQLPKGNQSGYKTSLHVPKTIYLARHNQFGTTTQHRDEKPILLRTRERNRTSRPITKETDKDARKGRNRTYDTRNEEVREQVLQAYQTILGLAHKQRRIGDSPPFQCQGGEG